jgi:hypothetical protein
MTTSTLTPVFELHTKVSSDIRRNHLIQEGVRIRELGGLTSITLRSPDVITSFVMDKDERLKFILALQSVGE